jgi:O-methyltransferase
MKPKLKQALFDIGVKHPEQDVLPYCLLSNSRISGIVEGLIASRKVKGATAEVGCASGGTSFIIGTFNKRRTHYAVDTFEGLVDAGPIDTDLWDGQFSAPELTRDAVAGRLAHLNNVHVIKGYFPWCAPADMCKVRFSFVHIDVDTYQSMRDCIDWFIPRMNKGGVIAMDDVIGKGTVGGKLAWEETDKSNLTIISENDPQVVVRVNG